MTVDLALAALLPAAGIAGALIGGRSLPPACHWSSFSAMVLKLRLACLKLRRPSAQRRCASALAMGWIMIGAAFAAYAAAPSAPLPANPSPLPARAAPLALQASKAGKAVIDYAFRTAPTVPNSDARTPETPAVAPQPVELASAAPTDGRVWNFIVNPPPAAIQPSKATAPGLTMAETIAGQALTQQLCAACHSYEVIRANKSPWSETVAAMQLPRPLTQEEGSLLMRYLQAVYPVPLSRAESAQAVAVLDQKCTTCHSAEATLSLRLTADGWRSVIASMGSNAGLTSSETDLVIRWLTENRGPPAAAAGN